MQYDGDSLVITSSERGHLLKMFMNTFKQSKIEDILTDASRIYISFRPRLFPFSNTSIPISSKGQKGFMLRNTLKRKTLVVCYCLFVFFSSGGPSWGPIPKTSIKPVKITYIICLCCKNVRGRKKSVNKNGQSNPFGRLIRNVFLVLWKGKRGQ